MDRAGKSTPIILYVVTEDWSFLLHRLPMARAAQRAGYQVHVAAHVNDRALEIESLGFHLHRVPFRRGSVNPFYLIACTRAVRHLYRQLAPDLVHHIALQPTVLGTLAAIGLPMPQLNTLTGLGFVFTSRSIKARLIAPVLKAGMRWLLNRPRVAVTVENPDDQVALAGLGVERDRIVLIPGSGVNTQALKPMREPAGPVTAAFVGRLLDDKGLRTLIAAHELLSRRGAEIRLLIAGDPDPANPTSIPADEIESWKRRPGVELLGHVNDIREVWAAAHIAVLPSRREGLPTSLLEAAACGRPLIATDVPGCREIARADINALLVPPDNPAALADAIEQLMRDPGLRLRFAAAGRTLVEREFSAARVGESIVAIYNRMLGRGGVPLPSRSHTG